MLVIDKEYMFSMIEYRLAKIKRRYAHIVDEPFYGYDQKDNDEKEAKAWKTMIIDKEKQEVTEYYRLYGIWEGTIKEDTARLITLYNAIDWNNNVVTIW